MSTEIVPSLSIANLVNQRAAIVEKMTQAFELIREAGEIAQAANLGLPDVKMSLGCYRQGRYTNEVRLGDSNLGADRKGPHYKRDADSESDAMKMLIHGIDSGGWQHLMHQSGMRSLMDATARQKWDESVSSGDIPELNAANIRSTFGMLHESRGDMFERGVISCFKALSWVYKTNLPQKFGKRMVMTYLTGYRSHEKAAELDDLVRVMSILDGKPEPDHRQGMNSLIGWGNTPRTIEHEYMTIKTFKNTNGHITFKRLDLIDKMNLIIAKHYPGALPAPK